MEQEESYKLSEISLPDASITVLSPKQAGSGARFAKLLREAQLKRREADLKYDSLIEDLVTQFSRQAAIVSKLKMEGQINTPVARLLAQSIPEGVTSVGADQLRERKDLDQLMSLELQLSPVQKRSLRNLNQSNATMS